MATIQSFVNNQTELGFVFDKLPATKETQALRESLGIPHGMKFVLVGAINKEGEFDKVLFDRILTHERAEMTGLLVEEQTDPYVHVMDRLQLAQLPPEQQHERNQARTQLRIALQDIRARALDGHP